MRSLARGHQPDLDDLDELLEDRPRHHRIEGWRSDVLEAAMHRRATLWPAPRTGRASWQSKAKDE